jgi:hypothetical protein
MLPLHFPDCKGIACKIKVVKIIHTFNILKHFYFYFYKKPDSNSIIFIYCCTFSLVRVYSV